MRPNHPSYRAYVHRQKIRRRRQGILAVLGMLCLLFVLGIGYILFNAYRILPQLPEQAAALNIIPPAWQQGIFTSDALNQQPMGNLPFMQKMNPATPLEAFQSKISLGQLSQQNWAVGLANPLHQVVQLDYGFAPGVPFSEKLLPLMPIGRDVELTEKLKALFAEFPPRFTPHIFVYNPKENTYAEVNGFDDVAAASVIKLPVLMAFFQRVDQGYLQKESPLLYQEYLKAAGAGELQYKDSGDFLPALDVATTMIQSSDNTCTNMIISTLGGADRVNEQLHQLGLNQTFIRNWLPDLEGSNKISMYEMATLLYNLDRGFFLTAPSRYDALNILRGTHNRRLLVDPLPKNALVAHKTGDIGSALGDVGIVYMPDETQVVSTPTGNTAASPSSTDAVTVSDPISRYGDYIVAVQVDRPYNDYTARDMIQRASRLIYDYMEQKRQLSSVSTSTPERTGDNRLRLPDSEAGSL